MSVETAPAENRFFRLRVSGLLRQNEDEFTSMCFESGAAGVAEDLAFDQHNLVYEPDVVTTSIFDVNVYFETAPREGELIRLQSRFPEIRLELVSEENRDWLAEWKKSFKPFLFASPFWIVPSWLEIPPEAPQDRNHVIFVEPGMAFGTGTHETTRMVAAFIVEDVSRAKVIGKKVTELLDVGTGTAVLALVAHRLGVPRVIGIDNDPEARRTARENLELNHAPMIEIPDSSLEEIPGQFDLVVANIIDGVLMMLCHELKRVLKPGGRLILSGILVDREKEFFDNFTRDTGLKLLKKTSEGEWSAGLLERVD